MNALLITLHGMTAHGKLKKNIRLEFMILKDFFRNQSEPRINIMVIIQLTITF